jgi:HNH endonuclease
MNPNTRRVVNSQDFSATFEQRFWAKVHKTDTCWIWTGYRSKHGYGGINCGSKHGPTVLAHVASWILHFGPIPDGMFVLHDCPVEDNKVCIRPTHLWLGTRDDNMRDAVKKGQMACGEARPHKLTWEQVDEMRLLPPPWNFRELARRYGVTDMTIAKVMKMRAWVTRSRGGPTLTGLYL